MIEANPAPTSSGAGCGCTSVCSLPADQYEDRVAMIRAEILPKALRRERLANGVALEFGAGAEMQRTLEELVAFERQCCSALAWNLSDGTGGAIRLSVEGLSPDSDFFRAVGGTGAAGQASAGASDDASPTVRSRVVRALQAAGLGAGLAFFLCCIAPMLLAMVVGWSVVAPLFALDSPAGIAGATVVLAVPSWYWLARRSGAQEGAGCGEGC